MRIEDLQRVLGGVIRETRGQHWLDTTVGGLRAAVIRRRTQHTQSLRFDVAVFTTSARELDPLHAHSDRWDLDGENTLLALRDGYVFAGCMNGILFATALVTPSVELVVATLWDLVSHARRPWHPTKVGSREAWVARERHERRMQLLLRIALALLVAALVCVLGK